MALVKKPANPVPDVPKPGVVHDVKDHETWETVAARYGVSVPSLIFYNFGTLVPEEINWYLKVYVGCTQETRDKKNYCFHAGATRGKIYVPPHKQIKLDPITLNINLPDTIGLDSASYKFAFEYKSPESGVHNTQWFRYKTAIAVEGEIKPKDPKVKLNFKKDQLKLAVEKEYDNKIKGGFSVKIDAKSLKTAWDNRSKDVAKEKSPKAMLAKAMSGVVEWSLRRAFTWNTAVGRVSVTPEGALEASDTPFIFRVAVDDEEDWSARLGVPCTVKIVVKGSINFGPSAYAITQLLETEAGALGITAVGTVLWTGAITGLSATLIAQAKAKADLKSLALWYVSAYTAKALLENRPSDFVVAELGPIRDEVVRAAEQDAVSDARFLFRSKGNPVADGPERQVLEAYRELLLDSCNRNPGQVKLQLQRPLEQRAMKVLGQ